PPCHPLTLSPCHPVIPWAHFPIRRLPCILSMEALSGGAFRRRWRHGDGRTGMKRQSEECRDAQPHQDKLRMYQIGRWVTDCRLAKGWTMVDVAMRLHTCF